MSQNNQNTNDTSSQPSNNGISLNNPSKMQFGQHQHNFGNGQTPGSQGLTFSVGGSRMQSSVPMEQFPNTRNAQSRPDNGSDQQ